MLFTENNKSIRFTINGYEFPEKISSTKEDNFDANWLICEIEYSEDGFSQTEHDACLLTDELEELTLSLSKILDGDESGYISSFTEPYLQISISKVDEKVVFNVHFIYDTKEWNKFKVTSCVEKEYATRILDELKELQKRYPER